MNAPRIRHIRPRRGAPRDDAPRIQAALDSPGHAVLLHAGHYRLLSPLFLPSGATLDADDGAVVIADGLPCSLAAGGAAPCARDVSVGGGRWVGAGFRFSLVRGLRLSGVVLADAPRALAMWQVDGYDFDGIRIEGEGGGIVVAGRCRYGRVRGVDAAGARLAGPCLAILSDGDGLPHGPIENSEFIGVAPGTVRVESRGSTIRNVIVRARGAAIPASPEPGGRLDNVVIDGRSYSCAPERRDGERFPSKVLLEPGDFLVTSPFGARTHPVTGEPAAMHNGMDGALWDGRMLVETGICAWRKGRVIAAEDGDGPAGTNVAIDHGGGLVSRYFHMERGSLRVAAGDLVRERALMGWMGRTGMSTGEHLHFQLEQDGTPINPDKALREL